MTKELVSLTNLNKAIIFIQKASVAQLEELISQAEAYRVYAIQSKKGLELQNQAAEIKMRAERKLAEWYKKEPKNKGGKLPVAGVQPVKTLKEMGLDKVKMHRISALFELPEKDFEKHIAEVKASNEELTTIGVIQLARELAKGKEREEKQEKFIKQAKDFKNENIEIWNGDFKKLSEKIKDNSIDLILTDPPYPEEFLPLWQDLFEVAERVLKPSKFLVCYANHQNLDKIFRLNNNLKYYWIFKLDFTLKPIAKGRNIIATWKPVLIYQKLPFKKIKDTIEDTIKFNYTERELHDKNWGQTIQPFEYLLEKFSEPNDLVFEPFAGTGTTLLACENKKRRCIGIEIEKKYIDIIKGRLYELRGNIGKEK